MNIEIKTKESVEAFLRGRQAKYVEWRRHLHQWPEIAFEEHKTAAFLKERLGQMGMEITTGIAGTGIVATLEGREPGPSIGLRADMDALPIQEKGEPLYKSRHDGVMHACGHDGHMAILLAAADQLSATRDFPGSIRFIFQPAEEAEGGGRKMVEEGLFERWPVGMVFGLHNWPGLPFGQIAVQAGPIMAAMDLFNITITGAGVHAAQPHLGTDAIVAAGALINALQTIASRAVDPMQPVVVSLTQIHGGHSLNALPGEVKLQGTVRSFAEETRETVKRRMEEIIAGIATAHSVRTSLNFIPRYPATVNDPAAAVCACHAANAVNGPAPVLTAFKPSMTSEDFAFMLNAKAGCYVWLGDGGQTPLHSPYFDFNDELIPLGARYFVTLARSWLADARQHGGGK